MMVVAAVAVIVGLMMFTRAQSGVTMSPLYSNLEATDASDITVQLDSAGIAYQLADNGSTILVPSGEVYSQRLKMSAAGLPAGGAASFALLDKQGITTSQFRQRIDYQRALGGEIGRTVGAMDGVQKAIVNLVIPTSDVFAADNQHASASVLLQTAGTTRLSDGQVQAIVNLVAQAVPDLSTDDISVTDQSGSRLWYPGKSADLTTGGDNAMAATSTFQNQMAADIERLLVPIVGAGKVKVAVTAALNFDQREDQQTTYQKPFTVNADGTITAIDDLRLAQDKATELYNAAGANTGVLGVDGTPLVTDTTVAGTPTTVAGQTTASTTPGYANTKDLAQFAVNRVDTAIKSAPGKIDRLGISVIVDKSVIADDAARTNIETLLKPFIDAQRGDQLTVQNLDFDTTEATAAQAQLEAAASSSSSSSGGIVGLLKIVFTALIILASLFFAWSSIRKAGKGDVTSTIDLRELEVVRDELRELTKGSLALPASGESGSTALPAADPFSLDPIAPSRAAMMANHIEGEISELIDAQPDEVALLLRNWLAERRTPAKR
ncbi:MAG: flagellar basal-body MS-ring/collar protein FliF, partial [Acidimicrobiia bacterium]